MNITIDFSRTFWHLRVGRLEITLSTRAWADDALASWDAGAVAYHRDEAGERSLRVPFMAAFWGRA